MNFLFPQAFLLVALLPVIVLFYLHRSRRKRAQVSALLFWQHVLERAPQRRFLGALRNPLSLLLQLLIFLLLLCALARPEFGVGAMPRRTVVVIDARARMQADGGRVFRQAAKEAQILAAKAGPDTEVAILAAEGQPRIVSPFSSDRKGLGQAISRLEPSDAGGGMEEAIALARRLLKTREGEGRLVLITDRTHSATKDSQMEEILVGEPRDNVGILGFAAKPLPASPQSLELFLKVGNFSSGPREVEVEFLSDGRVFDLRKRSLAAGEQVDFTTLLPAAVLRTSKGFLTARLVAADALDVDNEAYAFVPVNSQVRALLLSRGNPFLEKALASDPGVALEILQPDQWRFGMEKGFDVVVFDDWLPPQLTLESLKDSSVFFHGRSPMENSEEVLPAHVFETGEAQSPLLWNVNMNSARLARLRSLDVPADGRWRVSVPLKSNGAPAVVALENSDGRRVVATAFGTEDSNLPLRTAFPLLVSNIVHWLARQDGAGSDGFSAGATFIPAQGEKISRKPTPDVASAFAATAPSLTETPQKLGKKGFYEVRKAEGRRWVAVNTADAAESNLQGVRQGEAFFAWPGTRWFILRLWQWLALIALALMLLEWRWHHRRITE